MAPLEFTRLDLALADGAVAIFLFQWKVSSFKSQIPQVVFKLQVVNFAI
jgi:hypothetical protein